jgi:hypothetical protein
VDNFNETTIQQLTEILQQQLSESQSGWLKDAIKNIQSNHDSQDTQLLLSAMTSRKLSSEALHNLRGKWNIDEAARVLLLQTYIDTIQNNSSQNKSSQSNSRHSSHYDASWQAYRIGDENEKTAYIKGLSMLDPKGELLDIALHTGRTNNVHLFSAIALHNTYPAKCYDDSAFEQLVLKALFLDLNITHIESLPQRLHPELSDKCMDLVRERLAADRSPPISIWLAIDIRHLDDNSQALYLEFLSDPAKEHRYYSLLSLKQLGLLDQYQTQLKRQREVETEATILQLLAETE